jgi:hypothetical protein
VIGWRSLLAKVRRRTLERRGEEVEEEEKRRASKQ